MCDAFDPEYVVEVGSIKGPLAGFVDDDLPFGWCQLGDKLPARLTTHQNLAEWSLLADAGADLLASPTFVAGEIGQFWSMAFRYG